MVNMDESQLIEAAADPSNLTDEQIEEALDLSVELAEALAAVGDEAKARLANKKRASAPATEAMTVTEPVAASVPLAASVGRAAAMARHSGTPSTPWRSTDSMVPIVATGAGRGGQAGQVLDADRLSNLIADTLRGMNRNDPPRGPVFVARADWRDRYPAERTLGQDAFANGLKLAAIADAPDVGAALTASGGICSPVNVDWSVPTFAAADTPLADHLPSFQADRGGLTFTPPSDIAALAAATGVWTAAMDAGAPGNALTKPVLSVACGSPTTVLVDAVPTRLGFGNMEGRFAPEWVASNTALSVAAASRIRELNLLTHIDAASSLVNSVNLLGTARDLLATVDQVVAYYKDVHRLPDTAKLTAIFPRWVRDAMRADLVREVAHDDGGTDIHAVTDAQIDGWLSSRGVDAIWMLDGRVAKTTGGATLQHPVQTYAKVATNNPIPPWITKTVWNLFVEGTFQKLDGGVLDIGVIRDSTLDATNDYELFTEVFETVAFRGVEALTVISPVLPNGGSAGTVSTASYTGA